MRKFHLQTLIEIAIFASLAMLLDFLPSLKFGPSISISFAMVPIFIIAFRWGFLASIASGFLWGVLQIILGDAWILTPTQAFIEYFVAFACIGFAGLFINPIKQNLRSNNSGKALVWIGIAVFVGGFARYFWHFIAGVIFFKNYAYEAGKTPIMYSLIMNGITYFFTSLACAIVLILLLSKAPQLITSVRNNLTKMAS